MEIKNYEAIGKGYLIGTCTVIMHDIDVTFNNVRYFKKDLSEWISLPTKEYVLNGEKKYFPLAQFGEKTVKDRQNEILKHIKEHICNKENYSEILPF
ncbi:MAG: hypothetical protein WAN50_02925 [Minisyncoccia bacterium]